MNPRRILLLAAALALLGAGCEREQRRFEKPPLTPSPRAQADAWTDLQPGQRGRGMRWSAASGGYDDRNAYALAQGKMLFQWFNCVGCHAHGGGSMGPALMDEDWIYGKDPDSIFATIMDGRPNGMPSFRGRIPEEQAWELVAYVRSLSGLGPASTQPGRAEGIGVPPENLRSPPRPDEKKP